MLLPIIPLWATTRNVATPLLFRYDKQLVQLRSQIAALRHCIQIAVQTVDDDERPGAAPLTPERGARIRPGRFPQDRSV